MPDSAPLNLVDATVGFELDTITPRSIASARYVRHHEWLNIVLENPQPISTIIPPPVGENLKEDEMKARIKSLEEDIAKLEKEQAEGWKFHADESKTNILNNAILRLRTDFGAGSTDAIQKEVEEALDVTIGPIQAMRPVEIKYKREPQA